ncbi:hypothetical protein CTM88_05015 [Photobacterium aquimaris]|uniref:Uncharacterized protein n=1 Tax=Photobacterium aquimaris TaxID=512643 RepID=A0A2T3IPX1_9GAMM|nr:hypothetical protein [Photobacterium aquimaris]OBU17213.1 hypothetical protein AYY20_06225 [Photobacterium aquimaris]PSU30372.1 hypothetical protein CTM88_05015 [Photobacterium aquimaris]
MTFWKKITLTRQTNFHSSVTIDAVYPPEFEHNIAAEIQHLQAIYHCLYSFKKDVLSIICSYDGRLVKLTESQSK